MVCLWCGFEERWINSCVSCNVVFTDLPVYAVYVFSLAMKMHDVNFTADLEEHYQEFLKRKEARENALQDV